jgi:hypothetical protein
MMCRQNNIIKETKEQYLTINFSSHCHHQSVALFKIILNKIRFIHFLNETNKQLADIFNDRLTLNKRLKRS